MNLRTGIIPALALTVFLFCGFTAPQQCADTQPAPAPGPSAGEVIGILAGTGAAITATTIVIVHEHKSHNITGCVVADQSGLELIDDDRHLFMLTNPPADLKPGNRVSVHGKKAAGMKDGPTGRPFDVKSLNKEYGPCSVKPATPAKP